MPNAIEAFLASRKAAREKNPAGRTQNQIDEEFYPPTWIGNAAKRIGKLSLVTHPPKYSHPTADSTAIIVAGSPSPDGFLRTGNVPDVPSDVYGDAALLDAYAFVSTQLEDGRSILDHLRNNTKYIQHLFGFDDVAFEEIRQQFLVLEHNKKGNQTDGRIKQVYFPISTGVSDSAYHLLSIVTPSGLVFVHRERLLASKFSDDAKQAREARKKDEKSIGGYDDFPNILKMRFGGSQPQNVSRLNSSNSGEAWMLPSLPPNLSNSYLRVPKRDFFNELRWDDEFRSYIDSVHRLFTLDYNNINIRDGRKYWFTQMFDWVFDRALVFQSLDPGWSLKDEVQLPTWQKQWLDPESYTESISSTDWREEVVKAIIRWILATYRKLYAKRNDAAILGELDEKQFISEIDEFVRESDGVLL
ncbi:type I-F CRISPR-associated protein Csy1 [Pirellulaceae bacterium SH467]